MVAGSPRTTVLLAILAAALAVVAYANSLHGPFTFDDRPEIMTNPSIEDLGRPLAILRHSPMRPLTNVTYAVDYAVWSGRNTFGFHLTNLILHTLNVLLLFTLVRRLALETGQLAGIGNAMAFLCAALFAVHPLMTEAVSYVSGRAELLVTTFFLSSIYAFRRHLGNGSGWLVVGVLCLVLAVSAKETAAMIPFVLIASDALLSRPSEWRPRLWRIHAPLVALVILGGFYRIWRYLALEVRGAESGLTWQNIATTPYVAVRYVGLFVLPHSQSIIPQIYPIQGATDMRLVGALMTLIGMAVVAAAARRHAPLVTFGLTWFVLALAPSSILGLLAQTGSLMAEHRVYLASCGFFLAGAAVIVPPFYGNAKEWRNLVPGAVGAAAVLVVFLLLTIQRNRVWADPIRLWEEAARLAPDTPAAHLGLAQTYASNGRCDAAQEPFHTTLELSPVSTDAYLGLADCFLRENEFEDAALILREGAISVPDNEIRVLLALASLEESAFHRPGEALELCNQALLKQPDSVYAQDCVRRINQNMVIPER